jgi:hypothetical protein
MKANEHALDGSIRVNWCPFVVSKFLAKLRDLQRQSTQRSIAATTDDQKETTNKHELDGSIRVNSRPFVVKNPPEIVRSSTSEYKEVSKASPLCRLDRSDLQQANFWSGCKVA